MAKFNWADYPLVQRFLTGALHANSAPRHVIHSNKPSKESRKLLPQAEKELEDLAYCGLGSVDEQVYYLGYLADAGYSTTKMVDAEEGKPAELKVYEILDMEY